MHPCAPVIPPHLRRFVVEQDYAEYNAADQAVWRFVLLQTSSRLIESAHPAYRHGLEATGISVDRIPRIAEMNERLARLGWGAVCVDGFIPPRAFQEFQARGILPIAAEIRTREHLVYTPAPDIIHEAAGHAPILADPTYAAYLRGVGELGQRAFTLPEEERVYQAIYALSELKEQLSAEPSAIAAAELELRRATAAASEPSEATRASRLYWWTAEYGLVGTVRDYRLYGAGLLSSLGESYSCHSEEVRKLVLDERCTDVAYDITRPQPQLFVVENFEALHRVLEEVRSTMAVALGGDVALSRAIASHEVATVQFESGIAAIGVLRRVGPSLKAPAVFELHGPAALAVDGELFPLQSSARAGVSLIAGRLASGASFETLSDGALREHIRPASRTLHLQMEHGVEVSGTLEKCVRAPDGRLLYVDLEQARLDVPGQEPREQPHYRLFALGRYVTAHAGAADSRFYPDSAPATVRVPKPRHFSRRERDLIELYERAARVKGGGDGHQELSAIYEALSLHYPVEWLLRWTLLEALVQLGAQGPLSDTLERELSALERHFEGRLPIATGLAYLERLAGRVRV